MRDGDDLLRVVVKADEEIEIWINGRLAGQTDAIAHVLQAALRPLEAWLKSIPQRQQPTSAKPARIEPAPVRGINDINGNVGHGHVWPRPDRQMARCGGPSLCSICEDDKKFYDDVFELWSGNQAAEKKE